MKSIDLNADLGESYGEFRIGDDLTLLGLVTSVNVACGFHAGDPEVMRRITAAAAETGVSVGAHPSYPDLVGFGRRAMEIDPDRVAADVLYQVGALDAFARAAGTRVTSVKPHGALYHRMAFDAPCTEAVTRALVAHGQGLRIVLPAGSPGAAVAATSGVTVVEEAFCDRGYAETGSLADRHSAGALITNPSEAARRAVMLATRGVVETVDGSQLSLRPQTLCVHGDTPGSVAIARAVRAALVSAGLVLAAPA